MRSKVCPPIRLEILRFRKTCVSPKQNETCWRTIESCLDLRLSLSRYLFFGKLSTSVLALLRCHYQNTANLDCTFTSSSFTKYGWFSHCPLSQTMTWLIYSHDDIVRASEVDLRCSETISIIGVITFENHGRGNHLHCVSSP